ncbi:hypothetical protein [Variovorax sp.]|jgi:hypothetical protein|uniref:DUF1963 domain-containing protein n=1 Tax=Brugia timori TaxID=42155 RepID=A0A0R3QHK2_9BILA|nr:hypothetical protein [Variovorax sp.]MBS77616.1 hypothetical protein [Variovorax sp.]VDO17722.1 unnamed protein product [Brugia timori]
MNFNIESMTGQERDAFWVANLRAARKMLDALAPEAVQLDHWRRPGDPSACFGGWLPTDPYFQSLGVTANSVLGYPQLSGHNDWIEHFDVAMILFGDERMFFARDWSWDEFEADLSHTDHQVVLHRISNRLHKLGEEN